METTMLEDINIESINDDGAVLYVAVGVMGGAVVTQVCQFESEARDWLVDNEGSGTWEYVAVAKAELTQ